MKSACRSIRSLLAVGIPILIPILLVVGGCAENKIPRAKPTPPPLASAIPTFDPVKQPVSEPVESKLPFIITTDLTPLQQAIKAAVPEVITNAKHRRAGDGRFDFVRDGEPQVSIQDGLVAIRANYRGENQGSAIAQACRPEQYRGVLNGNGQLKTKQQDDLLVFQFDPTQVNFDVTSPIDSACTPSFLPAKEQLPETFEIVAVQQDLADAVSPETFSIPLSRVWQDLSKPVSVPVSALNSHLCLYGQPSELVLGPPRGTMQQTTIHGVARQLPTAAYETQCRSASPRPIKIATMTTEQATGTTPEQRPFKVLAAVPVPYAILNQELQNRLFHKSITVDQSRDPAMIERVTASDANGRVLLAVETSGGLDGTMYYWGTPQFDNGGKIIRIPDLQMANESKRALDSMQMGSWQQVDRQLRERLRDAATIDISGRVDRMKTALSGQHQAGDLNMDMLMARQQPDQIRTTKDGLVASYFLEGTATATGRVPVAAAATGAPVTRRDRRDRPQEAGGVLAPADHGVTRPSEREIAPADRTNVSPFDR
ncbi:MAG TPA: DUF4403 family protein [Nitrospiraceae bacterium]|nr:DUF4403 family protein [Nitrospiraceae bacterium]